MKIIYIHGLDSSANSMKGLLLEDYCRNYHSEIEVLRPDLNQSPDEVTAKLYQLVQSGNTDNPQSPEQVVVIGSSLGGYFASMLSNQTGCPAVLLNPSTKPHLSLQRYIDDNTNESINRHDSEKIVVYRTSGGWNITLKDLEWFNSHSLEKISYPEKVFAVIKQGDELLDPMIATNFYRSQGVKVDLQVGGDHRMTDFQQQLPMIMEQIISFS